MDREQAHKLIDQLYDMKQSIVNDVAGDGSGEAIQPERELPKDKRVIRTKSTGDNVYELDEVAKTKRWVRNPEVLKALGWELNDVQEVDDKDLLGYAMGPSIYRVEE